MNLMSEQLGLGLNVVIDSDNSRWSEKTLGNFVINLLGEGASLNKYKTSCYYVDYISNENKKYKLVLSNVTYLGGNGQHPSFKKRVQLKKWYKELYEEYSSEYTIKFIGIYHYNGMNIFVDFNAESYIDRKLNSSSAHVYINDLYKGVVDGFFRKTDVKGNIITTVRASKFKEYLENDVNSEIQPVTVFELFNKQFEFEHTFTAEEALTWMYDNGSTQFRQNKWSGWLLEGKFSKFLKDNNLENVCVYTALINKGKKREQGIYDFDLFFTQAKFYADLKANNKAEKTSLLNDQDETCECILQTNKLWYAIYEFEGTHDSEATGYEATKFYNKFKYDHPKNASKTPEYKEMGSASVMMHDIKFTNMFIVELNRVNFREILTDFLQGHQSGPTAAPRKPKFKLDKRNIDNFVIYRYSTNRN